MARTGAHRHRPSVEELISYCSEPLSPDLRTLFLHEMTRKVSSICCSCGTVRPASRSSGASPASPCRKKPHSFRLRAMRTDQRKVAEASTESEENSKACRLSDAIWQMHSRNAQDDPEPSHSTEFEH